MKRTLSAIAALILLAAPSYAWPQKEKEFPCRTTQKTLSDGTVLYECYTGINSTPVEKSNDLPVSNCSALTDEVTTQQDRLAFRLLMLRAFIEKQDDKLKVAAITKFFPEIIETARAIDWTLHDSLDNNHAGYSMSSMAYEISHADTSYNWRLVDLIEELQIKYPESRRLNELYPRTLAALADSATKDPLQTNAERLEAVNLYLSFYENKTAQYALGYTNLSFDTHTWLEANAPNLLDKHQRLQRELGIGIDVF